MTEQEALKYLKDASRSNRMVGILPKSDIGECLIKSLEEIQQYRAIGTVEECLAAVEKMKPKKPIDRCMFSECPTCGNVEIQFCKHCPDCGQALIW